MKKKTILLSGGLLMLSGMAFSNLLINNTSLTELSAKAAGRCIPDPNSVCVSKDGTGIFPGYKEVWDETEETVD